MKHASRRINVRNGVAQQVYPYHLKLHRAINYPIMISREKRNHTTKREDIIQSVLFSAQIKTVLKPLNTIDLSELRKVFFIYMYLVYSIRERSVYLSSEVKG